MKTYNESIDRNIYEYLLLLLDTLESSTQKLSKLFNSSPQSLQHFLSELINSLKPIGLYTKLKNDAAGKQIIDLLETQAIQFKIVDNNMTWSECRRFISRILDQQNFKPQTYTSNSGPRVTFLSLEQSYLQRFDALIIASVDKNSFPSANNHYIFFNEQVRRDCSVSTWRDERHRQLQQFRYLVNSSPFILFTLQTERNGEQQHPSSWLEAIETFYMMAYGKNLDDDNLDLLVNDDSNCVAQLSEIANPAVTQQPKPVIVDALLPTSLSISQYQCLVDCPYQYYASSCLGLLPTEELQEELNKADFGSLVHESIHAFFDNVPTLPGPFKEKINALNKQNAINMLQVISEQVFKMHFMKMISQVPYG